VDDAGDIYIRHRYPPVTSEALMIPMGDIVALSCGTPCSLVGERRADISVPKVAFSIRFEVLQFCREDGSSECPYFHISLTCEVCRMLGCDAVWLLFEQTFRKNLSPLSSGWK
jgi:hypothetical protein